MPKLDGFPQANGAKLESILDKAGPAAYTQITVASPPTGGQDVTAREFGLNYIEQITPALSDNGQYFVYFSPAVSNGKPVKTGKLMWVTASTGGEVGGSTNLSARTVRLRAMGLG